MITHSLGEIDVLFPLFAGVKEKHDIDIELIFAVNDIYRKFKLNDFYNYCSKKLDIKITRCQLPNKFDYQNEFFNNRIGKLIVKIYFKFFNII